MSASILPSKMQWPPIIVGVHEDIVNVGEKTEIGKRESSALFLLWVDIPAVLHGRDFSDELYGGKQEGKE